MYLILAALFVLVRAITAGNATLIVTSAAGLVAIGFTGKPTNGYSLGMAVAFAAALACYAVGLYAATTRCSGPS